MRNIRNLFDKAKSLTQVHELIYLFLHYPLLMMFVKIKPTDLIKICMIVAIVLVSFIDKLKEFNSFEESGLIVSKRNSKGVSVLTPFDETFVK